MYKVSKEKEESSRGKNCVMKKKKVIWMYRAKMGKKKEKVGNIRRVKQDHVIG